MTISFRQGGCVRTAHRTSHWLSKHLAPKAALATPMSAKALLRFGVGAVATVVVFAASAAQGQWTQGAGQGDLEYYTDSQGMRLHIACPTQEGSADAASSVSLMSASSSQEVKKFTVKVGGHTFEGPFAADNRAGEDNFTALLDGLRKTDAVVSYAGKTLTFPKSNAAKVLPAFGKKGFSCNLG